MGGAHPIASCPASSSRERRTVWVLMRRLNSSCSHSMMFVERALFHWHRCNRVKGKQARSGLLKAVGDRAVLEAPFADERFVPRHDLFRRGRIDHVVVVGRDLAVQAFGGMSQQAIGATPTTTRS